MKPSELMTLADEAREASYSPYSRFAVGAALLGENGEIFLGCNVENASFGLSCCAERTAVFKAVSEGQRRFRAIAVTAGPGCGAPPCGACRQVLAEFAPNLRVSYRTTSGRLVTRSIRELLPAAFDFHRHGGTRASRSTR
jgi:cytidine deaminase